jgi:NADPH:quinone reductase-like Zn-dependent oxidoreductase
MEVVATGFGNPSVLKIVPTDEIAPTTGQVAIDVRAAGVNHVDYTRYADPAGANKHGEGDNPFPMKLGVEVSGVVTAVGKDAHGPAGPIVVGDEVIAYRVSGGYTDRLVAPSSAVVPKPTALSWTGGYPPTPRTGGAPLSPHPGRSSTKLQLRPAETRPTSSPSTTWAARSPTTP